MPNKVFPVNNWKIEHPYWILHIWISLGTKFQFKLTILVFWPNLQNKVLPISNWKIDHPYWVLHFWISTGTKFQLKLTILRFWTKFTTKEYLAKIGKKWTTYKFCIFQISQNQISTSKMKFGPKWYFLSKTEKMNTTIELCIFKWVYIPNFSLNWQFSFSGPSLPKKSISRQNWKKVNDMNSTYLKFLGTKLQLQG